MPGAPQDLKVVSQFLFEFRHRTEDFAKVRSQFFNEYFGNRKYLIEVYLDAVASAYREHAVDTDEFAAAFLGKFIEVLRQERRYFFD